ncbi:MAG: DUF4065 domain-containing protein [Rhodothermaceae bacterium]|nr:DUF4065 domain-containing protein [Rhodothermaceae bacterium]MXX96530.1 DUF4065 domain-containing protein [Rhodothermaceae bacterium]MXZ18035.1 DUF4065 domain-containing protein [Rhodothermaceae bacterium]MXZ59202.1 DUF4065 domain-containing protein [Rhodothermaceae bacterium]MYB90220.1 DUF4065 domain-containing protein [Rhodothermaceae bacterium]
MSTINSTIEDFVIIAYLLKKAAEEGRGLTPLQINKLVYICHGWALGKLDRPLIDNRFGQIEAWKYGPVVRNVYERLKRWKAEEITFDSFCEDFGSYGFGKEHAKEFLLGRIADLEEQDPQICKLLDVVWYVYKDLTGGQLITITHEGETPWQKHVKYGMFRQVVHGVHIPDSTIAEHYQVKLRNTPQLSDV